MSSLESNIPPLSNRADLIRNATVIVWDELPMAHRAAVECVDRLCKMLKNSDKPFGGIPFIGVGDFRQVAPVVPNGGETATVLASIKSSDLWRKFELISLHFPIRSATDPTFTHLVDTIGEDTSRRRVNVANFPLTHSIDDIAAFLFPPDVLSDVDECLARAFLSVLNVDVDTFNYRMLQAVPGEEGTKHNQYLSPLRS